MESYWEPYVYFENPINEIKIWVHPNSNDYADFPPPAVLAQAIAGTWSDDGEGDDYEYWEF